MTDDGTIRPALTDEEWAKPSHWIQCYDSWATEQQTKTGVGEISASADWLMLTSHQHGEFADFSAPTDRHALAALSLYGQPFGFTPDDVELLRRCADACDGTDNAKDDDRVFPDGIVMRMKDVRRLQSIASRIASLLPPETTP